MHVEAALRQPQHFILKQLYKYLQSEKNDDVILTQSLMFEHGRNHRIA